MKAGCDEDEDPAATEVCSGGGGARAAICGTGAAFVGLCPTGGTHPGGGTGFAFTGRCPTGGTHPSGPAFRTGGSFRFRGPGGGFAAFCGTCKCGCRKALAGGPTGATFAGTGARGDSTSGGGSDVSGSAVAADEVPAATEVCRGVVVVSADAVASAVAGALLVGRRMSGTAALQAVVARASPSVAPSALDAEVYSSFVLAMSHSANSL